MTQGEKRDSALTVLMRDFGYAILTNAHGRVSLVSKGIRGFTSDRTIGTFRSVFAAAEYLRPIVSDPKYSARHAKITTPIN